MRQKLLIIVGPTASGKSSLAVALAKKFDGEIISADSRQVYRGLDIGTGKIPSREMRGVRHHLLDVVSPKKNFSAQDFLDRARCAIDDIASRGTLPIVAGGTGFYLDALTARAQLASVPPDRALRARLEKKTVPQLFAMLEQRDPRRAKTIDPRNKRRLIRALEIAAQQGRSLQKKTRTVLAGGYDALWIGISPEADELRESIRRRIGTWMRRGLIAEVRDLRKKRIAWKRIEEFGFEYSLVGDFLRGKLSKKELPLRMKSATWRYARKQMGYWRRNADIRWFDPSELPKIERVLRAWKKMLR